MSSSGQGPAIYATFIDRINGEEYATQPLINQMSFGSDMRHFTGAFDFEVQFGPNEKVDVSSHDFVEFWFYLDSVKFQIGAGFIEDFVKKTSANGNVFQGNGRDFLAQLMMMPFKTRTYKNGTSYLSFLNLSLETNEYGQSPYLKKYLAFRNRNQSIVDNGIFKGPMIFMDVATTPRAQIMQEYAEMGLNLLYQDRLGRMVVYGRTPLNGAALDYSAVNVGETLSAYGDSNVSDMQLRQNFSKVISECTVLYQGQENIDTGSTAKKTPSLIQRNTDPRVDGMYQPLTKIFSSSDLGTLAGGQTDTARINNIAKSNVRKSNQNLSQIVVVSDAPFFVNSQGKKIAYQVGQVWRIKNEAFDINADHKLVGIHYSQDSASMQVQLAFVEPDTLI